MTVGELYGPAMEVQTQQEADNQFFVIVQHLMRKGRFREEAEAMARSNIGYYAGYYDSETRQRVERLFRCSHPVFGAVDASAPVTSASALAKGREAAVNGNSNER